MIKLIVIAIIAMFLYGLICWAVCQGNGDDNEYLQIYEQERKKREKEQKEKNKQNED